MTTLLDRVRLAEAVFADTSLSHAAHAVHWALTTFHNDKTGRCNPSIDTIAGKCGWPRRSVIRALVELEQAGVIAVQRSRDRKSSNRYVLDFGRLDADSFTSDTVTPPDGLTSDISGATVAPKPTNHPAYGGGGGGERTRALDGGARPDGRAASPEIQQAFETFWRIFPNQRNRRDAETTFAATMAKGIPADVLVSAARDYAADWTASTGRRSKPMQAAKWLAAERWADGASMDVPRSAPGRPERSGLTVAARRLKLNAVA